MDYPVPSPEKTHHVFGGIPIYAERFLEVRNYMFPGIAAVRDASGWYHIDFTGKAVYSERYSDAGDFIDGVARVRTVSGTFVHIDTRGKRIDSMEYVWAGEFSDRTACVYHSEYGASHITTSGELLYNEWYYDVRPFGDDGRAVVRGDEGWIYVDRTGLRLGNAPEPGDSYPRGTVRKRHVRSMIPLIVSSEPDYDACIVVIRHAEREPFYLGERGTEKSLTVRGMEESLRLARSLPPFDSVHASPISRCMKTGGLMGSSVAEDRNLGAPSSYVYDGAANHQYYAENDTIAAARGYLAGIMIPGQYPPEEGTQRFLGHLESLSEEGKHILCITHDVFLVACIGTVSGYRFENDWIEYLDGFVLFRHGDDWTFVWREGRYSIGPEIPLFDT